MFNAEQAEMMKVLLYSWSKYGAVSLVAIEENLNELCNQINMYINEKRVFNDSYENLDWRSMMLAIMKNCPNVCAHYNPNERKLNLNFDTSELNMLYGNLTTVVATKRNELCEVSREILDNDEQIFVKQISKTKQKVK